MVPPDSWKRIRICEMRRSRSRERVPGLGEASACDQWARGGEFRTSSGPLQRDRKLHHVPAATFSSASRTPPHPPNPPPLGPHHPTLPPTFDHPHLLLSSQPLQPRLTWAGINPLRSLPLQDSALGGWARRGARSPTHQASSGFHSGKKESRLVSKWVNSEASRRASGKI